mgnify:CR=1 FL=1
MEKVANKCIIEIEVVYAKCLGISDGKMCSRDYSA